MNFDGTIKRIILSLVILAVVISISIFMNYSAKFQRGWKSLKSDWTRGLERMVTVYDYNGRPIKSWKGKFDVASSERETWFDNGNGKRVIIHGGIVINEET